jgi:putative membrane protein
MIVAFVLLALGYIRGWRHLRSTSAQPISAWRAGSFLTGLFLIWVALGSPLVAYDHHLLTVHMIQHLLLMTVAPSLILLGEPLLVFSRQRSFVRRLVPMLSRPALCWSVSVLTLVGWHVPSLFVRAMQSAGWHSVEQSSFLGAGLLFWWPVVQPWPNVSSGPQWSTLLYLFFASLPCDVLSAFLVFSDRVAYPVYFSMPRHFGLSVLEDQQFAAALMWTCVTVVYLVPAAIVSTRLLSPRSR